MSLIAAMFVNQKILDSGTEEIAQWLRIHATLPEDPSLSPGSQFEWFTTSQLQRIRHFAPVLICTYSYT